MLLFSSEMNSSKNNVLSLALRFVDERNSENAFCHEAQKLPPFHKRTLSLTVRAEHRLSVFFNIVLIKIFYLRMSF
jgi:hypothetical protein